MKTTKIKKKKKFSKNILLISLILIIYILSLAVYINFEFYKKSIIANDVIFIENKIIDEKLTKKLNIEIPVIEDMVPQGITVLSKYILISAYDYYQNNNSLIYVLNRTGNIVNICTLDTMSHVGGIAYDKKNKVVWVAGSYGHVNSYDIRDIIYSSEALAMEEIYVGTNLKNYKNDDLDLISSLTIKDDLLFVGTFSLNNSGLVKTYRIVRNNLFTNLNYMFEFKLPNKVQGITFYKDKLDEYILFSVSYGRRSSSNISVYRFSKNVKDYNSEEEIINYKLPPMLEQIWLDNEYIYALYESNAKVYNDCPNKSESLSIIHYEELLRSVLDR